MTFDQQLLSSTSPDLLVATQGSAVHGTKLPSLSDVACACFCESSSSDEEDEDSSDKEERPDFDNTPMKTTGEDVGQSETEIEMGLQSKSQLWQIFVWDSLTENTAWLQNITVFMNELGITWVEGGST